MCHVNIFWTTRIPTSTGYFGLVDPIDITFRNSVVVIPLKEDVMAHMGCYCHAVWTVLYRCPCVYVSWWRHQMETFSALLAICAGNSPVPGEFPAQRPVRRSFGVFFDLRLNKRLSKQSWGWWFETPSRSLWRHCNGMCNCVYYPNSKLNFVHVNFTKFHHAHMEVISRNYIIIVLMKFHFAIIQTWMNWSLQISASAISWHVQEYEYEWIYSKRNFRRICIIMERTMLK